jgi:hypothetical protein
MMGRGINPMALMQSIQGMMQGGQNPQVLANQILQQNPQFARMIQGQNVQQMAMEAMRQQGIDPNQIAQMFGGRR